MGKTLKEQERQIKMAKENMGSYVIATELHKKANFLRLLFREKESKCLFEEALDNYKKALPDDFKSNLDRYSAEIHGISDVEFHLGNYDNAIDICMYYRGEKPVSENYFHLKKFLKIVNPYQCQLNLLCCFLTILILL